MTSSDLTAQVQARKWFHSMDLGGGVVTPGHKSVELLRQEADRILGRIDLKGRTVLDIGSWDGFFSFEAKRRGAARVLATDSYCWGHPTIRAKENFDLAHKALGLDIDTLQIDAADLSEQTVGQFDVVLFLGVFYHRYDAVEVLGRVSRLAKHVLVVESQLDGRDVERPAMIYYPGRELNGDETNWWGPNDACLKALLDYNGFKDVEVAGHPTQPILRGIFHAWRDHDLRLAPLPSTHGLHPMPPPPDRSFVKRQVNRVTNRARRLLGA